MLISKSEQFIPKGEDVSINMKKNLLIILSIFSFWIFTALPVQAEEKINYFGTVLEIDLDGTLHVGEIITVTAENDKINHGIYRDIPTQYTDTWGITYPTELTIESVMQDGKEQEYHTEKKSGGTRVYIGKKNEIISPGVYEYSIEYSVKKTLAHFDTHDELYWNVTGNSWEFPIEKIKAWVILPSGIPKESVTTKAYTGEKGSTAGEYSVEQYTDEYGNSGPLFTTNKLLGLQEGFTIVTGWKPGFVSRPTQHEKVQFFLRHNWQTAISVVGLVLLFSYYFILWFMVGRDPKKGTIIPQYEPPKGISPCRMRYLKKMNFDNECITSQIIDMASRGFLSITETASEFTFKKQENKTKTGFPEDDIILTALFSGKTTFVLQKNSYSASAEDVFTRIKNHIQEIYKKEIDGVDFHLNRRYFYGALIIFSPFFLVLFVSNVTILFAAVWLSIWTFGVAMLVKMAAAAIQKFSNSKNMANGYSACFLSCFALIFVAAEVFAFFLFFTEGLTIVNTTIMILYVAVHGIGAYLLTRRTITGRAMLDYLEGFTLFLSVTEKDRLNFFHPVEMTPELFQKYVSYAFALGVDQAWSERFTTAFTPKGGKNTFEPQWYHGKTSFALFASHLGSISSSIDTASTKPSSSGSSFGSSGGGMGGGGGGGW